MKPVKPLDSMIMTLRGRKVIVDSDLAALYEVPTKALNQAIKRNAERFPGDFAFRLTQDEKAEVVANCDHLARTLYEQLCKLVTRPTSSPRKRGSSFVLTALDSRLHGNDSKRLIGFTTGEE